MVETGMRTVMGQIAQMIAETSPPPPLQLKLDQLGKVLIVICLAVCCLVTVFDLPWRGTDDHAFDRH